MLLSCGAGEDSSPLGCKEIKPINPKGNQSWIFIGRTDAESPILWPPDAKNWLIGKEPDAEKDWRREEKGTTEDEMVGWHHQLDGHEFKQALGVGYGQGSLACCSPWEHRVGHSWVIELNIFLDSTYKWYYMIFVFLYLTLLSMIIYRSIHVAANGFFLFFFMAE